jgi:subtilisin family serine protease
VHGTLVTGLIAAIEENGFGMAGVAPGVEIVAVPVCTPLGASASDSCLLFDVLRGVDLAWEREAQLLNLSFVGPANALLERAMVRLDQLEVLVVASAGNEGTDAPRYPAAYASVIGVGAVDPGGARYARSNRGASAELLAPGVEILSAVPGNAFAFGSGTSYAAAHVTGMLAVLIGAGADPPAARAALFREAHARPPGPASGGLRLPPICDVLARLGRACASP